MSEAGDMTKDQQLSIRLEAGVAERAEALVARLSKLPEYAAFRMNRATILRMAMLEGLAALEARHSPKGSKPR